MTGQLQLHSLFFGILRARIADFYRSHKRKPLDYVETLPEQPAEETDATSYLSAVARKLLASLPERQRETFILNELHAMTTRAIAEKLGRPHGTVCMDLLSARRALSAAVKKLRQQDEL
jgi:RNA polymerase sigma factor (sigma-70 family)